MNIIRIMGHKIFFNPPQNILENTFSLRWDMDTIWRFWTEDMALGPLDLLLLQAIPKKNYDFRAPP